MIKISEEDNKMLEGFAKAIQNASREQLEKLVIILTIDGSQEEARGRIPVVREFLDGELG